jgi:hypothetical protein
VITCEYPLDQPVNFFSLSPAGSPVNDPSPMTRLCAWCGKRLASGGSLVSHGICGKCYGVIFQGQFEFADHPPEPAAKAPAANRRAKPRPQAETTEAVQPELGFSPKR